MEFYRALRTGKRIEIKRAHRTLIDIVRLTTDSKFFHRLMRGDDENMMFAFRHLDEFVHRLLHERDSEPELVSLDEAEVEANEDPARR